jgi:hypothetical protein
MNRAIFLPNPQFPNMDSKNGPLPVTVLAPRWDRVSERYSFVSCARISGLRMRSEMYCPTLFVSRTKRLHSRGLCEKIEINAGFPRIRRMCT